MTNENNENDPKHPRIDSLQALLRFAIDQTKSEDAPNNSHFEKMEPEKKKFLEDALKNLTIDIMEELEKAVRVLESPDSSNDEKLNSLEMIVELAGDIDLANNFLKIGGSRIIMNCLDSEDVRIRKLSIELIGEVTQNNPFAQSHFTEIDAVPKLVRLLNDSDPNVIRTTLHAVSCLVRRYEPALAIYIEKDGLEMILKCLQQPEAEEKLLAKAAFLVDALCVEFGEVREQFIKLGAVEILANLLTSSIQIFDGTYSAKIEHLLSALKTISDSHLTKEKLKAIENIQSTLKHILDLCQNKEECEEIISHSQYLRNYLLRDADTVAQRPTPTSLQVSLYQDKSSTSQNLE